ncbi:MAG: hypothetical protein AABW90_01350 [Nanoarchaeota archaeon]
MRSLSDLSVGELLKRKENIKKGLDISLKNLIEFVDNIGESFFYLKDQENLSKLEGSYTMRKNKIYKINQHLPFNYRLNMSEYDKIYEKLIDKISDKNSAYIKRECDKIRKNNIEEKSKSAGSGKNESTRKYRLVRNYISQGSSGLESGDYRNLY